MMRNTKGLKRFMTRLNSRPSEKYLGVRLKRSEIGHLYLEQADQYTQKRQQNIVKNLTR